MLEKEKIIKVEVTSPTGRKLVVAEKDNFSFPKAFADDMPARSIIIIRGSDLPEFELDKSLYVVTYMKNGDRIRYAAIVRMSLPYQLNIQLRSDYGTVMEERRKYFKVEADINCFIAGYVRNEEVTEFDEPVAATIKNINIGGVFIFRTELEFFPRDMLFLNFGLDDKPINIMAKILRAQRGRDGVVDGYGCQFDRLDPAQEEIIARFVYSVQLKKRLEQIEKDRQLEEAYEKGKKLG